MFLSVGQKIERSLIFTQEAFDRFAALSGDHNPIHVEPEYAASSKFGRTVAHGMYLYSLLNAMLSDFAPDWLQQEVALMFPRPTFAGERLSMGLAVTAVSKTQMELQVVLCGPDGAAGMHGQVCMGLQRADISHPKEPTQGEGVKEWGRLALGQTATQTRCFAKQELNDYFALVDDRNPLPRAGCSHLPEGLLGGMISALLGEKLPGRGTNWLKQSYRFFAPATIEKPLTAWVTISRIRPQKALINLQTAIYNERRELICAGESLVLVNEGKQS